MNNKVVTGEDMMFKEDIKLIDSEIAKKFGINDSSELIERDEFIVIYDHKIHVLDGKALADDSKKKKKQGYAKIYTSNFNLTEESTLEKIEEDYFNANKAKLDAIKDDFIKNSVKGITPKADGSLKGCLGDVVSKELISKINEQYSDLLKSIKKTKTSLDDIAKEIYQKPIFSLLNKDNEKLAINDGRIYNLLTVGEYIAMFEKSFEPNYYKEIYTWADSGISPEEISSHLMKNKDKVHRMAFPLIRNKIWHSDRSFKLYIDGKYYVPQISGSKKELESTYHELLEYKIKISAAMEYR